LINVLGIVVEEKRGINILVKEIPNFLGALGFGKKAQG